MSATSRAARRTAVATLLTALLVAPAIPAQPRRGAEIVDPAGDAAVANLQEDSADIRRVWINETRNASASRLEATIQVQNLSDDRSVVEKLSWSVAFSEQDTNWTLRAFYDDTARLSAEVRRDGSPVEDARASAAVVNDTVRVTWSDYGSSLAAGAELDRVYAWSASEELGGETTCHGRDAADCAPNEGYGRAVVLVGEPPTSRGDGVVLAADRGRETARDGEHVTYELRVRNTADAKRSVVLNTTAPAAYDASLEDDGVSLDPGASRQIDLTMTVPRDAAGGALAFTAVAAVDGELVDLDLRLDVGGDGDEPIRVQTGRGVGRAEAGSTVTYTLNVTHQGRLETTYELEVVGRTAEWVSLNRSNVTLASNETAAVRLTVHVPEKAPTATFPHVVEVREQGGDDRVLAALGTRVQGAEEVPGDGPLQTVPAPGVAAALASLGAAAWIARRD